MNESPGTEDSVHHWTEPEPKQVEVLLLGTTHLDNPGLDEVNPSVDDVLEPDRQAELVDLVDHLAQWDPDRVCVERPWDRHEDVHARYHEYRSGERRYDEEEAFEPIHPNRNERTAACRSEVVQIGFRLADRLGHETVHPVDDPMTLWNEDAAALEERGFTPTEKVPVELPDTDAREATEEERFANSTIREDLARMNREDEQRFNHSFMFAQAIRAGEGENFGGPDQLATWYRRNLHIVHNLWRVLQAEDDRLFLLVGNGHVRVLRHLLTETPQFCPVSALPLLTD